MIVKVNQDTVVIMIQKGNDQTETTNSLNIREEVENAMKEEGITGEGCLEINVYQNETKILVFAVYIRQSCCKELYCFESSSDLVAAYESKNRGLKGSLLRYDGKYYAAVFETEENTLCEYAKLVPNGRNYYYFLMEHGIILSKYYLFQHGKE